MKTRAIYFVLASMAMTSLVACTKMEDTAPPRKITFEKAIYRPQTKADDPVIKSVMDEFTSFKCKAFLHADNGGTAYYPTQDMFGENGETISAYTTGDVITTNSASVAYWAPSHDYYWPKGSRSYINFVGWYDSKGTLPSEATETSLKWNGYTVGTEDNLLFADEAWHYKANATNGPHYDGVTEGVPMIFHHALAKLCIEAKVAEQTKENKTGGAGLGNTNWEVTLSNISLAGVYTTGNLVLTNTEPSETSAATSAWTGSWTPTGSTTTISMDAIDTPLKKDRATKVLQMRSVMPQTVTDDIVLAFDYNIVTKFNTDEYAHEKIHASVKLNEVTGHIAAWEMNKKITYTIIIDPVTTTIKIDPAMVDWVTEAGGSTTL
ncbi:MAG: fimbrillin family protein [Bacteroidaceae bacterium]|nr:fimbrillin family protein [Bacteroidaceae bacterium]